MPKVTNKLSLFLGQEGGSIRDTQVGALPALMGLYQHCTQHVPTEAMPVSVCITEASGERAVCAELMASSAGDVFYLLRFVSAHICDAAVGSWCYWAPFKSSILAECAQAVPGLASRGLE